MHNSQHNLNHLLATAHSGVINDHWPVDRFGLHSLAQKKTLRHHAKLEICEFRQNHEIMRDSKLNQKNVRKKYLGEESDLSVSLLYDILFDRSFDLQNNIWFDRLFNPFFDL